MNNIDLITKTWTPLKVKSKRYSYFYQKISPLKMVNKKQIICHIPLFRSHMFMSYENGAAFSLELTSGVYTFLKLKPTFSVCKPKIKGVFKTKKGETILLLGHKKSVSVTLFKKTEKKGVETKILYFYEIGDQSIENNIISIVQGEGSKFLTLHKSYFRIREIIYPSSYYFCSFEISEDFYLDINVFKKLRDDYIKKSEFYYDFSFHSMNYFTKLQISVISFSYGRFSENDGRRNLSYCFIVDEKDPDEEYLLREFDLFGESLNRSFYIHKGLFNKEILITTRDDRKREHPIDLIEFWKFGSRKQNFHHNLFLQKTFKSDRYYYPTAVLSTPQSLFSLDGNKRIIEVFSIEKGKSIRFIKLPPTEEEDDDNSKQQLRDLNWLWKREGFYLVSLFEIHLVLIFNRKKLDKRSRTFMVEDQADRIKFILENNTESEEDSFRILSKKLILRNNNVIFIEFSFLNM